MRKMVNIGMASLDALKTLAADTDRTFQELIDEAIEDLLKKHDRPVTVREMFVKSLARGRRAK
jgi:hypothetical protein